MEPRTSSPPKALRPRCITMWDFSWIERRWPGAGYENGPQILDELRGRGYDAIRLDAILYVDLCNEWPGDLWCPFFKNNPPELTWGGWHTDASIRWMRESCEAVRKEFPELPIGYSFEPRDPEKLAGQDLTWADYVEPHLWMARANEGEFYKTAGYKYDRYSLDSYQSFVDKGEPLYRSKPEYWRDLLRQHIMKAADGLKPHRQPLMTTECWGVVDLKDWPLLNWDWVKDLCRVGVETAAGTGQWVAIATSNFCGPQFRGMWRDVKWHRHMTGLIKRSPILSELQKTKLAGRL